MTLPKFVNAVYALLVSPSSYALLWFVSNALVLLSCWGLWNMRKWGVYVFLVGWLMKIAGILWFSVEPSRSALMLGVPIIVLLVYLAVIAHHWQNLDKPLESPPE